MDRHSFSSSAAVFGGMNSKENDGTPASSSSRMAGTCGGRLRDMITRLTVRRQIRTTVRLASIAPRPTQPAIGTEDYVPIAGSEGRRGLVRRRGGERTGLRLLRRGRPP